MSLKKSNVPCPRCLQSGVTTNMLGNQAGRFETFCVNPGNMPGPHTWNDTEVLNAELQYAKTTYPAAFATPASPQAHQGPIASQITIDPENKKVIEELCKQQITSGAELKGILFDAVKGRDELEKEVVKLRATVGTMRNHVKSSGPSASLGPNQFIVTLPEWSESLLEGYAEAEGKTPGEWLNETLTSYLEQFAGQTA